MFCGILDGKQAAAGTPSQNLVLGALVPGDPKPTEPSKGSPGAGMGKGPGKL